jgi:glucuronoarabinoxylan endo-1,4-beta-xylanase
MKQQKINSILISLLLGVFFVSVSTAFAAEATVKAAETHQTMLGFGASVAWYENTLANHPQKSGIYDLIYNELGLDILRIRNTYRGELQSAENFADIVNGFYQSVDWTPQIMISSWSPTADLKSNNSLNGGDGSNATLIKEDGEYVYADFAQYWLDALNAYFDVGIYPDYISLQNELSYDAEWESCRFDPTENTAVAGYDRALDSVYAALQTITSPPAIIGPEVHGIGYNTFQNYANRYNHDLLEGYAYHLYHGGSADDPDRFIANLATIAEDYPGKPIFQTEYDQGNWLNTVWLMNNCFVHGNVAAYLWWELIWGSGGKPLVTLDGGGFEITKYFWAVRQFSKYLYKDWKRVTAETAAEDIRMSAFISPDSEQLTVVVINVGSAAESLSFDIRNFTISGSYVTRTSEEEDGEEISASYDGSTEMAFPARSITTLAFTGTFIPSSIEEEKLPGHFSLWQNYPNPFNPTTTIRFSLEAENQVRLKIFDVLGQELETLINEKRDAGSHRCQYDASHLEAGIYFYRLTVGGRSQTRKMLLIK